MANGTHSNKKKSTSRSKGGTRSAAKGSTKRTARGGNTGAEGAVAGSIVLGGIGLLLLALLLLPAEKLGVWPLKLRDLLFGVLGLNMYYFGALLLYFSVRAARGRPLKGAVVKAVFAALTLSGLAVIFSGLDGTGLAFKELALLYLQNGKTALLGGGLLGLPIGGGLLALCGRPVANIVAVLLLLGAAMAVTGITPAELWEYFALNANQAKQKGDEAMEDYRARHAERVAELEAKRAEQEAQQQQQPPQEAADPAARAEKKLNWFGFFHHSGNEKTDTAAPAAQPRAGFDIDLGPDPVRHAAGEDEPIEPIVVGPGGTFGLDAVRQATAPKPVQQNPAPVVDEFNAPIAEPQVILPDGSAPAAAPAPAVIPPAAPARVSAADVGETVRANPFEDGDGWIRVDNAPVPGASIASLASAAMNKPQAAENAAGAAAAPAVQPSQNVYRYPPLSLFNAPQEGEDADAEAELRANAQKLVDTLDSFGVKTRVLDISRGPSVTRYELQPLAGVKISRITSLSDDIALNLAVGGVRIEAPIPGKPAVGIEVPNRKKSAVSIRGIFESQNFNRMASPLTMALGKDIAGVAQVGDLCKMPHLLIAGSTGSGKSVCVNSIIVSFLYRNSPDDVKMILIDPKVVELAEYNGIPHLLMPVVTEPRKAAGALGSAVAEMERRYHLFADNNVRDIKTFNKLADADETLEKLPYIVIVIDELADLMMVSGKEVEDYICRIAQKARAAGMHLIVATQRPSVDVITGLIKANIPSRIAFAVSSQVDSRTILDGAGAEKLLGMGDMLYMPVGANKPVRIQGTYVTDEEISRTLDFIKQGGTAEYNEDMMAEMEKIASQEKGGGKDSGSDEADSGDWDPMLNQCAEAVIEAGQASTSLLQRRCKLGYARAARIMDQMEQRGIIGPYEGAKPRAVLMSRQQWQEMSLNRGE